MTRIIPKTTKSTKNDTGEDPKQHVFGYSVGNIVEGKQRKTKGNLMEMREAKGKGLKAKG